MNNKILVTILIIAVAAAAFFGGMKYQQSQVSSSSGGMGGRGRGNNGIFGRNGERPIRGQILSLESNTLTVKLPDGSTKIAILSDNTRVGKMASASKGDLSAGEGVFVIGSENSDGSVTAQTIQINSQGGQGQNNLTPTP